MKIAVVAGLRRAECRTVNAWKRNAVNAWKQIAVNAWKWTAVDAGILIAVNARKQIAVYAWNLIAVNAWKWTTVGTGTLIAVIAWKLNTGISIPEVVWLSSGRTFSTVGGTCEHLNGSNARNSRSAGYQQIPIAVAVFPVLWNLVCEAWLHTCRKTTRGRLGKNQSANLRSDMLQNRRYLPQCS